MAPSWLLLLVMCFSVLQFGHSVTGGNDRTQLDKLWQEINNLKKTQSHHSACLRGIRLNRKCFVVSDQSKSYSEANADCVAQGGTLAIPQNIAENDALRDYARCSAPECKDFWIGMSDSIKEGCFVDVNGKPVTFFNWAQGQWGHLGGQDGDCVALSLAAQGKWREQGCGRQKKYFCEFLISQCASRLP